VIILYIWKVGYIGADHLWCRAVKHDDREKSFHAYTAQLRATEQEVKHAGKSNKDEEVSLSLNLAWWRRKSERKEMSL
jgi:hypothetical protein